MSETLKFGNGEWATKKGSTLAYNSENGNFKPLPFTFDRAGSATRVNKEGLIEVVSNNEPRIDFKDDSNGALKLEPSRTNLFTYSEAISNFSPKSGTFVDNFAISPDGTQNATKLTAINVDPYFYQSVAVGSGDYTISVYVKGIGSTIGKEFLLILGSGVNSTLQTITGEWKRFTFSGTLSAGTAIRGLEIPNPAVSGDEVLVWGMQLEQGSYATSYIPTQGSSVTRVAESCKQTPPSGVFGTNEVSFVIDFEINGDTPAFSNIFNTNKNTASSFGVTRFDSSGLLKPFLFDSGINVGDMTSTTSFLNGVRGKFAVGYKSGDSVLVVQGNVEDTNSSTFSNFNITEIHLNDLITYFGYFTNLKINEFKLYNTRLSNAELQALTTI